MALNDTTSARTDLAWRIVGLVNIYRLLAAMMLLAVHLLTLPTPTFGAVLPRLFVQICVSYVAIGALLSVAGRRHWPNRHTLVIVHSLADSAAIAGLLYASGGVASNLAVLLVLPVGGMVLLADGRYPLFIAAMATLGVLGQQIVAQVVGIAPVSDYPLAGVTGAVIFFVALSVWPVANRLRESEALVKRQELDLANLAQLSQYIVQHLRESILVVDPTDRIRLINESAAQVLGDAEAVQGALLGEVSAPLLYRLSSWRRNRGALDATAAVSAMTSADGSALIEPHFAALGTAEPVPVLIFLEDTGALAAKVQQSKLAALGRLSASIAHEIRNPVGAISHAAQLLDESLSFDAGERRLTEIVCNNAKRVSSIVENVLGLSRRATPNPENLQLAPWCTRFSNEFCSTMQIPADTIAIQSASPGVAVRMDTGHLHQIVWNLCQNALLHGGGAGSGAVEMRFGRMPTSARPFLEVSDRGPGIAPEDSERVFEPFFTRGARGTGLGLFLARELAEINDATLLYASRDGGGSVFRIVFADPSRWQQSTQFALS
jgi:two-component system, NtrC family, sensor histidine kinase PilS